MQTVIFAELSQPGRQSIASTISPFRLRMHRQPYLASSSERLSAVWSRTSIRQMDQMLGRHSKSSTACIRSQAYQPFRQGKWARR